MRPIIRSIWAGGLVLALTTAAAAQTTLGDFGGYPAGITTGSPSGANWSGFYGLNPGGYPLRSYNQPYSFYGSNYVLPQTGGYNTGYYSYRPAPTYSYRPGVTNYYSSGYYAPGPGTRTYAPGTTYYAPGTTAYGTYRAPGTVTYGAPLYGGSSTYVAPNYGTYVQPRGNFIRRWSIR
jgi:hypothetical protein